MSTCSTGRLDPRSSVARLNVSARLLCESCCSIAQLTPAMPGSQARAGSPSCLTHEWTAGLCISVGKRTRLTCRSSLVNDPVGSGLVASLARPGRNVTGTTVMAPDVVGKRFELLKEVLPKVSRVAVLQHPDN